MEVFGVLLRISAAIIVASLLLMGSAPAQAQSEARKRSPKPSAAVARSSKTTAAKQSGKVQPRFIKPVVIYTLEKIHSDNRVAGVTQSGQFVTLQMTAETKVRRGDDLINPQALEDGAVLACWGGWDSETKDVFAAASVVVHTQVDGYKQRKKIGEACRKLLETEPRRRTGSRITPPRNR
ncbi:MAG: hypothetical protein OHK0029_36440 [Armatimonadaceae bacterium]